MKVGIWLMGGILLNERNMVDGATARGGELGVLRVREHPLNVEVHPLTAKSTPSK